MKVSKTSLRTRTGLGAVASTLALVIGAGCISLNYPEPDRESPELVGPPRAQRPSPGTEAGEDVAMSWSELTRAARELRQRGELDAAREKLDQAAIQVAPLPPTNAERQAVFGMRARLADAYARRGELEAADALADELFAQAEAEPALCGSALATLAASVAKRREQIASDEGREDPQLPLYGLALECARNEPSSRSRFLLAEDVARRSYRADDMALARRGIDQAIVDAQRIIPTRRERLAGLEAFRARIALAQDDLDAAETAAVQANTLLDEIDADPSSRAITESLLVDILVAKGDPERAAQVATGARARMDLEQPLTPYAQRRVLSALAHVEHSRGDRAAARRHLEEALAIPGVDLEADRRLVRELTAELDEADASALAPDDPQASTTELQ